MPASDFGRTVDEKLAGLRFVLERTRELRRAFPGRLLISPMTMPTDQVRKVFEEAG
jgi:hypothetical protein